MGPEVSSTLLPGKKHYKILDTFKVGFFFDEAFGTSMVGIFRLYWDLVVYVPIQKHNIGAFHRAPVGCRLFFKVGGQHQDSRPWDNDMSSAYPCSSGLAFSDSPLAPFAYNGSNRRCDYIPRTVFP